MTVTINGVQCSEAEVLVPLHGAMWARAILADASAAPATGSTAVLVAAGVTFACTVTDSGERGGVFAVELTGGAAGWARPAPLPAGYRNDAGQRLSEVAVTLGEAVGETVILAADIDRVLGAVIAVAGGPDAPSSGAMLTQLCRLPSGAVRIPWHVDPSGITRLGPRLPLGEITATEIDADERRAWVAYAEEHAALLLPGATVDGRQIAELRIEANGDGIREVVTLAGDGSSSAHTVTARLLRWVLDIVRPLLIWRGVYTYRITGQNGARFKAVPVSSKIAPALDGLRFWPGAAGHSVTAKIGARCLVAFPDGDPNTAAIVGWMPLDTDKGKPTRVDYDGAQVVLALGTKPVGRGGGKMKASPVLVPVPGSTALVLTITDPDGGAHVWSITGVSATGGAVSFAVTPGTGVDILTGEAVVDQGRAEILV